MLPVHLIFSDKPKPRSLVTEERVLRVKDNPLIPPKEAQRLQGVPRHSREG